LEEISDSIFNVEKGNENLVKANEYSSEFGRIWAFYFIALGVLMLVFDWLKS
jgi:hypothetical protein